MGSVGRDSDKNNADHIPAEREVFEDESSPQQRGLYHRNLQMRFRREMRDPKHPLSRSNLPQHSDTPRPSVPHAEPRVPLEPERRPMQEPPVDLPTTTQRRD